MKALQKHQFVSWLVMPKEYEQLSIEDRESLGDVDLGERDPEQGGADTNPLAIDQRAGSRAMTYDETNRMLRSSSSVALASYSRTPRACTRATTPPHRRRRPRLYNMLPSPRSVRPRSKHAQLCG